MVKRLADEVARLSKPLTLFTKDQGQIMLMIDPRDTMTPALLWLSDGCDRETDFYIGTYVTVNREILDDYQRPYLGVQFEHGSEIPSPAQIRALLYAQEQITWFDRPRGRLFNQATVLVCTDRGWLAERDGQLRITSEGRRMLRCIRLDQEDRRKRQQNR